MKHYYELQTQQSEQDGSFSAVLTITTQGKPDSWSARIGLNAQTWDEAKREAKDKVVPFIEALERSNG